MSAAASYTARAIRDLEDIWSEIAKHNPPSADATVREMTKAADLLAQFPNLGVRRAGLPYPVRVWFRIRPYALFYMPAANGVRILRIADGRRDPSTLFDASPDP